jgi:hypothetical protein
VLEKWVRFGFVFCAKLALKNSFLIDKQEVKNFSIWVRFAKSRVGGEYLIVWDNRNAVSLNMAFMALNIRLFYQRMGNALVRHYRYLK